MLEETAEELKDRHELPPVQRHAPTVDVLDHLAEKFHVTRRRVEDIYTQHLHQLTIRARVRDYVAVLATRLTRESLRNGHFIA
jgi:hypothetical protein